ncbi:50S ribosomal protein L17 [candidate division KSB1 bacterium]|nr:50S ribosomal protein L17 [candidate division KSB1 bacterium]
MRHLKSGRKLGRTASHRKALLTNLATEVFRHKSIVTTTPKAKEARSSIERLITFAKKGDLAARRQVLRSIRDKAIVKELFETIAPKYAERNGGYTRIIKIGHRNGDNASLAILELVGFEGVKAQRLEKQRQDRKEREKKAAEQTKSEEPEDNE